MNLIQISLMVLLTITLIIFGLTLVLPYFEEDSEIDTDERKWLLLIVFMIALPMILLLIIGFSTIIIERK